MGNSSADHVEHLSAMNVFSSSVPYVVPILRTIVGAMYVNPKFAHISITLLPSAILFWYIRAIQTPNRPNITKYYTTW